MCLSRKSSPGFLRKYVALEKFVTMKWHKDNHREAFPVWFYCLRSESAALETCATATSAHGQRESLFIAPKPDNRLELRAYLRPTCPSKLSSMKDNLIYATTISLCNLKCQFIDKGMINTYSRSLLQPHFHQEIQIWLTFSNMQMCLHTEWHIQTLSCNMEVAKLDFWLKHPSKSQIQ